MAFRLVLPRMSASTGLFSQSLLSFKNSSSKARPFLSTRYQRKGMQSRCFSSTEVSADSKEEKNKTYVRAQYADDWEDPNHPEWQQFTELNSKRKYYHNRETGDVTWAPPSNPELDIFLEEKEADMVALTPVPINTPNANLFRRGAACLIDMGISLSAGGVFGLGVYIDLDNTMAALPSIGFSAWVAFLIRDIVIEQGTRSPGKKLMKLEIVRVDGQLPSRYNNFFRQIYLPVYAASALLMPYIFFFAAADVGCMIFTKQNMRFGDFIGRTRVIEELADREERLAEKLEADRLDDLKE